MDLGFQSYLSVYSNMADTFVQKGDKIKTKQFIGAALTDDENKTEVHFEIWKHGEKYYWI
mgnify:CR=1 FL=1